MPQLLIDTDVFCKLTVSGILPETIGLFNVGTSECARLAALRYMLQRGRLRRLYGDQASDEMIPIAEQIPIVTQPSITWLDKLARNKAIDVGEAQLFASAAETGILVITGDKRALRALKSIADFPPALSSRIIIFEALLIALCDKYGPDVIRRKIQPLITSDNMVKSCFSPGNNDPLNCLLSYFRNLEAELDPLVLWNPRLGANP